MDPKKKYRRGVVALIEAEKFALCHSDDTQQKYYADLVDHISSPAVKISIAKAMAFGGPRSEEYCFGNPYIKSQFAVFV